MASIRARKKKDGSTVYHVQVRMTGFPARTETFKTERDAKRWARQVEVEMDEGRHFRNAEARRRSLSAAIERYIAEEIPKKKKPEHKPKAQGQMHRSCLRWWGEQIGDLKLSEISVPIIVEYRDKLARTPYTRANPDAKRTSLADGEKPKEYPRSAGSVNSHLRVLSHLFSVARKQWHWVTYNPVEDVAPLPVRKSRSAYSPTMSARNCSQPLPLSRCCICSSCSPCTRRHVPASSRACAGAWLSSLTITMAKLADSPLRTQRATSRAPYGYMEKLCDC